MLFLTVTQLEEKQIEAAVQLADGIEIQWSSANQIEVPKLARWIEKIPIPVMVTLTKKEQGEVSLEIRELVQALFSLKPQFLNIEYGSIDLVFLQNLAALHPEVKIICSYYDFQNTIALLDQKLLEMESPIFYAYQLVTAPTSTLDALKMMLFVRGQRRLGKRVAGICLGEKGIIATLLGPIIGNFFHYLPQEEFLQGLKINEFLSLYRYRTLNAHTEIYGLIGHCLNKSLSHFVHNRAMQALQLNAVYVKISILPEELAEFFSIANILNIRGLSVTMPLKEAIIPYVNQMHPIAREMQAINTLSWEGEGYMGFNTDGEGALQAVEKIVAIGGKKIVFIGAGGAAKAIAYLAYSKGAQIVILNRTAAKARELAVRMNGRGGGLEEMAYEYQQGYDIMINCTPDSLPIDIEYILPGAIVMDIKTLPSSSSLLAYAKERGARVVYGYEMFINQAIAQIKIWFKERVQNPHSILQIMFSEMIARL